MSISPARREVYDAIVQAFARGARGYMQALPDRVRAHARGTPGQTGRRIAMRSVLAAVAITENATLQDGNLPVIERSTLTAVVVPFVLATCQQGGAPGAVLAASLSDGQSRPAPTRWPRESAFGWQPPVYRLRGRDCGRGTGWCGSRRRRATSCLPPSGVRALGAKHTGAVSRKHHWLTGAPLPRGTAVILHALATSEASARALTTEVKRRPSAGSSSRIGGRGVECLRSSTSAACHSRKRL